MGCIILAIGVSAMGIIAIIYDGTKSAVKHNQEKDK